MNNNNVSLSRKEQFERDQRLSSKMVLEFDNKFSLVREENNSNIRNILIFESAMLTTLMFSYDYISGLEVFYLNTYFFIAVSFLIVSVLTYSILLKKISNDVILGLVFSKNIFFSKLEKRKDMIQDWSLSDDQVVEKLNEFADDSSEDDKKKFILDKHYLKGMPKWLKEIFYKFDFEFDWVSFHSHVANYTFLVGIISLVFVAFSIYINI